MAARPDEVWIVVPAYNEAPRLGSTLQGLLAHYPHVVVVDDGSADQTGQVARSAGAWVLRHVVNCGQGAALQTGISFALGRDARYIVTFDADGQHDPAQIASLLEPLETGKADVTLGSRFLGQAIDMPWSRRLIVKAGVLFTRLVSRVRVTDAHNGMRALTRSAASKVFLTQDRMAHASEILDQIRLAGLTYVEAPVTVRYSRETLAKGQSSMSAVKIAGQLLLGKLIK